MIPKFFGQYLIEKRIISPAKLIKAIEYQEASRKKLGKIAEERGYLDNNQVRRIYEEQKRTDRRFGDLAVELGYITPKQLEEIILIQKNSHTYLGDALVAEKILTQNEVDKHLKDFQSIQEETKDVDFSIPIDHSQSDSISYIMDLTCKMIQRVGDIPVKPAQPFIFKSKTIKNAYIVVTIKFTGDLNADYSLFLTEEATRKIAENDLEESNLDDVIVQENAGELANIICGNIVAYMEKNGKRANINVPKVQLVNELPEFSIDPNNYSIYMPLSTTLGLCGVLISLPEGKPIDTSKSQSSEGKYKVVIVDDAKSVVLRLQKIISEMADFEVVGNAQTGEQALELIQEKKPDLITMDIVLPGISGLDVIKKLRDSGMETNVIVISSLGGSQEKVFEAIQYGAKNVIVKPFETNKVQEIIRHSVIK